MSVAAARAFRVMPCLAAAETVSEWKRSNQKELINRRGNIDPVDVFLLLEPPMWNAKYGDRHG
jgi:hypothetical protein